MPRDPWDESRREPRLPARPGSNGNRRRPDSSGGSDRPAHPRERRPVGGPAATGGGFGGGLGSSAWDRPPAGGDAPRRPRPDGARLGPAGDPRQARSGDPRPGSGDPRRVRVGDPQGDPLRDRRAGPRHARQGGPGDDGSDDSRLRRKRSWPQRLILGVGLVLVLFCMLGASVAGYALVKYESIERVDDLGLPSAAAGEPENFLIVAVDTREGQGSKNTDTIMVLRIDPKSDRLALTSFPRDLLVTVADTGETGMINAVYNRPGDTGPRNLIDTLQQNFGVPINHFVEVNFESFQQVVDAVGGVPVWLETAARDNHSGFYSEDLGCVNLDGTRGLQFVRSRYLDIQDEDGNWVDDPKSDEHRVLRQQIFIQRAMSKALADVKTNPVRLQQLVDIGVSNITLDDTLGLGDILDLAEQFRGFDASKLEAYPLPVTPYPQDENRLVLNEAEAEPVLNVFRGLPPGEIGPALIDVQVLNGTVADPAQQREGLATDVSGALQQVGFHMAQADDADTFYAQTTIQHAPGQELYAQRVARHISSTAAIPTEANPELASGQVRVIAGLDFTTVHEQATPIEALPAPAGAETPVETTAPQTETTTTTAVETPVTTPTTENPFIIGAAPEGASC